MAMKPSKSAADSGPISVIRIDQEVIEIFLVGATPLIFNCVGAKAERELLFPSTKKNAAERQSSMKHDPVGEFRASAEKSVGDAATRLLMPSLAFKGAMRTAALRLPGSTKAEVGQLVSVTGDTVGIYGRPRLLMSVVRMADPGRTPDIRTRAICPEWCCKLRIRYTKPLMTAQTVVNLLAGGGFLAGVGDFRQEKGAGSHGQFVLVGEDDADWRRIASTQGRVAQDEALAYPVAYDSRTDELWRWFESELIARGRQAKGKDVVEAQHNGDAHGETLGGGHQTGLLTVAERRKQAGRKSARNGASP